MKLTIEIDCDNAAFATDEGVDLPSLIAINREVERILPKVTRGLREGSYSGVLLDSNGNTVGGWTLA